MPFQTFERFESSEAFAYASMVRGWLFGEPGLFFVEDFFDPNDATMLAKALQPNSRTLLHDFIECCISQEIEYVVRKAPSEVITDLERELLGRGVDVGVRDENDRAYAGHLQALYVAHILDGVVNSVSNLLFQDRSVLHRFGECIAVRVRAMRLVEYSNALEKDGVLKRCKYWPTWVKGALIMRDKGHCAICQRDISGMLAQGAKVHIDHIVPLAMGGTNDVTNLQLLCDECNLAKGGRAATTSAMVPRFF